MQLPHPPMRLISPTLGKHPQSEAQVLGAVTWLLMHSQQHQQLPLQMLGTLVLPAIKVGQYILLSEPSRSGSVGAAQTQPAEAPVAWVAWANLSAEAEAFYLSDHLHGLRPDEWTSGDRMWFIHWVAPFGHTKALRHILLDHIQNSCARALHHRGIEHGMRVNTFRGRNVTAETARHWWRERPMLAAAPTPAPAAAAGSISTHHPDASPHH